MAKKRLLKSRNPMAQALRCKIFHLKIIPPKKGKGTVYTRKGRTMPTLSGPFHVGRLHNTTKILLVVDRRAHTLGRVTEDLL